MPQAKTRKPAVKKPAAKKPPTAKETAGVPEDVVADSVRATSDPVVVDGNYTPLPVEHRLTADAVESGNVPATEQPDVHGESAKLKLAQANEPTPTDTVSVGGETITLVHSPTNVDPVVLGSQRADTVLKDRARSEGKAHLVDTPHETLEGKLRAGDIEVVELPGYPEPKGRKTVPPANLTENEVERGRIQAEDKA